VWRLAGAGDDKVVHFVCNQLRWCTNSLSSYTEVTLLMLSTFSS